MHEIIEYKNEIYPLLQSEGNAAQWVMPFAQRILKGKVFGYDIGCNRAEWSYPGAMLIDPAINATHDAMDLPPFQADYIFSSHCLEHLEDWKAALDYWHTKLKPGGILFLYLPHMIQQYWHPSSNKKHKHSFYGGEIEKHLHLTGWEKVFATGYDLNYSFTVIAEKSMNQTS